MNTDKKFSSKGHDLSKIKKGSLHGEVSDEFELDIDYEGLQEQNYENTEWIPPSIEKAEEYRVKHSFHGGSSKMKDIKMTQILDFGTGVPLYFQYIKSFAILFFFMSLLSVPSILFCFYGEHILPTDRDALQLYRFTLVNTMCCSIYIYIYVCVCIYIYVYIFILKFVYHCTKFYSSPIISFHFIKFN